MGLLVGCGGPQVRYAPLNNPLTPTGEAVEATVESRGPVSPDAVRLFVTQKPDRPYVELGVLSYTTSAYNPNEERSFVLFRNKAAEIGADGVIILHSREDGNFVPAYYGWRWGDNNITRTTFRGLAIQFTD